MAKSKLIIIIVASLLVAGIAGVVLMKTVFNHTCPPEQMVISNMTPKVDEEVTFSFDNASVTSWSWDFGDGNKGDKSPVTHAYTKPGKYKVVLRINGSADCDKTEEIEVKPLILEEETNLIMPVIEGPQEVSANQPVTFKETSGKGNSWSWGFGETLKSDDSKEQNPTYTFKYPGTHKVTVFINGDNKAVAEWKVDVIPGAKSATSASTTQPTSTSTAATNTTTSKGSDAATTTDTKGSKTPSNTPSAAATTTAPAKTTQPADDKVTPMSNDELIGMFKQLTGKNGNTDAIEKYVRGNLAMDVSVNGKIKSLNSYLRAISITGECKIKSVKQTNDKSKGYLTKLEITE